MGVGGTHGSWVWWWEMGPCKSSLLPKLSLADPAHLPLTAQHPGPDHSCCLTWKRNSREDPTRFCCYSLKHDLASGKSSQCCVTVPFSARSYRVRWDVVCKYLFWIIFLCPTGLFSAAAWGGPAPVSCGVPAHTSLHGSGRGKHHSGAPWRTDLFWLTDFQPHKCFPHSAVLLVRIGNIKAEPCALLRPEDCQRFGVRGLFS